MYHTSTLAGAAGAGALAFTGFPLVYVLLAAFALIAAGLAAKRIAPRREA